MRAFRVCNLAGFMTLGLWLLALVTIVVVAYAAPWLLLIAAPALGLVIFANEKVLGFMAEDIDFIQTDGRLRW